MARRHVAVTIDDLTGETVPDGEAETIEFAVNRKTYSIDLNKANAAEFHAGLQKYIAAAAKAHASTRSGRHGSAATGKGQLVDIRRWGQQNGYTVSARGRISGEVVDAYNNRR